MPDVPHDPLVGSTVDDRYLVLAKVAHGGMSTVYLARDSRLNRNIALKVPHAHLAADPDFIARLQREAQSAASLSHPHVVQIYDQVVTTSHPYLVLEYIDGHTLREVINARGALTPREALKYLEPVVEGLAAAHAAGLVHRDVKPENVLISRADWVKIGDFGLSRASSASNKTAPLGTVAYVPPELVQHNSADARSDIYSAGIMLYELLTGSQPFAGQSDYAVLTAHVDDDVPPPSAVVPGLPPAMDELVRFMTERDPDNRPSNGAVLLEDLRHIRNTLTPAELDSGGNGSGGNGSGGNGPGRAAASGATEVLAGVPLPTQVLGGGATTVINQPDGGPGAVPAHPTSVLPARGPLTVDEPDDGYAGSGYGSGYDGGSEEGSADDAPLGKRAAKAAARERAKAAATPLRTLGKPNRRRRAIVWTVVVLLLAVLGAFAGWFLGMGPGALATVPDLHNKSVAQAEDALHAAGFGQTPVSQVFDEKVAAGFVVGTDPTKGTSQRKFLSVAILVSKGPVLYPVPDVTGAQIADAKAALTAAHLAPGTVTGAWDEKAVAGTVLGQDPPAGKDFRSGTKVNLTVSKGPKPIPVPSVVGKPSGDAQAALQSLGLVAVIAPERVNSRTVPAGSVVSQSPDGGTLTAGGKVVLTISKGPRMVKVPNMVGKQVDAAKAELKALGFDVKVENLLGGFFGTVRFQDPQGGEAPEGSTITLQVI